MHTPNCPHRNTQICCKMAHIRPYHQHSEGKGRKSERGSLRGFDRLAAWLPMETTYVRGMRWAGGIFFWSLSHQKSVDSQVLWKL